jgi:hypothetical protein
MKPFAIAALLLAVQGQPGRAEPAQAAPSEALVERFLALLPDREEIQARSTEIDPEELSRLAALNPGKEREVRSILETNRACSDEAVTAGTLRMLRTVARDLGEARLKKMVSFYEGPDYAAFAALAARIDKADPSSEDMAALDKLMAAYPLEAFHHGLDRAEEIISADQGFMAAAMKCVSGQMAAFEAAGIKAN